MAESSRLPPVLNEKVGAMSCDPVPCRMNAADCLRAAESATNLETREEFIALGHIWLRRAAKFEGDATLLKTSGDFRMKTARAA